MRTFPIFGFHSLDIAIPFRSTVGNHQAKAALSCSPCDTAYSAVSIGKHSFMSCSGMMFDEPSFHNTLISHPLVVLRLRRLPFSIVIQASSIFTASLSFLWPLISSVFVHLFENIFCQ